MRRQLRACVALATRFCARSVALGSARGSSLELLACGCDSTLGDRSAERRGGTWSKHTGLGRRTCSLL